MEESRRIKEWREFSKQEELHIRMYCERQYRDNEKKNEKGAQTAQECITNIERYASRFGSNARGTIEALRDMLKIAHYGQIGYLKLKEELGITEDVYKEKE